MRSIEEKLERVKRSLEKSLAELEKMQEAELAMRELCSYELEQSREVRNAMDDDKRI